jgi:hypothetical protein
MRSRSGAGSAAATADGSGSAAATAACGADGSRLTVVAVRLEGPIFEIGLTA